RSAQFLYPVPGLLNLGTRLAFYSPLHRMWLHYLYYARPQPATKFRELFNEQFRLDNVPAKIAAGIAINGYRALDNARQITAPLLIIGAEKDTTVSIGQALALKECLPQAKLLVIPDCGHIVQHDAPDVLKDALLGFLRKG